jgi:hypothetical protein
MNTSEYDGIWFLPLNDDSNALHMQYFSFRDEFKNSAKVDSTPNGDTYYISFFRRLENNEPEFDDAFEAVFADPEVYIKNLVGAKLYGCIVRKTEESGKWFEDYLKNVFGHVMIMKLKAYANSISNLE